MARVADCRPCQGAARSSDPAKVTEGEIQYYRVQNLQPYNAIDKEAAMRWVMLLILFIVRLAMG
ncbi:MAG: hypothetical protein WBD51_15910, partial [Burkholderiaceae bacterium]